MVFVTGFPLGTLLSSVIIDGQTSMDWVPMARAFVGGTFLYVALVELAPPGHAHTRAEALWNLLAFATGVGVSFFVEAMEDQLMAAAVKGGAVLRDDASAWRADAALLPARMGVRGLTTHTGTMALQP
jgi:hypothetical protein